MTYYNSGAVEGPEEDERDCAERYYGATFLKKEQFESLGLTGDLVPLFSDDGSLSPDVSISKDRENIVIDGSIYSLSAREFKGIALSDGISQELSGGGDPHVALSSVSADYYFSCVMKRFDSDVFGCLTTTLLNHPVAVFSLKRDVFALFFGRYDLTVLSRGGTAKRKAFMGEPIDFWHDLLRRDLLRNYGEPNKWRSSPSLRAKLIVDGLGFNISTIRDFV